MKFVTRREIRRTNVQNVKRNSESKRREILRRSFFCSVVQFRVVKNIERRVRRETNRCKKNTIESLQIFVEKNLQKIRQNKFFRRQFNWTKTKKPIVYRSKFFKGSVRFYTDKFSSTFFSVHLRSVEWNSRFIEKSSFTNDDENLERIKKSGWGNAKSDVGTDFCSIRWSFVENCRLIFIEIDCNHWSIEFWLFD